MIHITRKELLEKVKTAMGISGEFNDDLLMEYIEESLSFLRDAGVDKRILRSSRVAGTIVRGVIDLWDNGAGKGDLSPYFQKRAIQLVSAGDGDADIDEILERLDALEDVVDAHGRRLDVLEDVVGDHGKRLDLLDEKNDEQDGRLDELEKRKPSGVTLEDVEKEIEKHDNFGCAHGGAAKKASDAYEVTSKLRDDGEGEYFLNDKLEYSKIPGGGVTETKVEEMIGDHDANETAHEKSITEKVGGAIEVHDKDSTSHAEQFEGKLNVFDKANDSTLFDGHTVEEILAMAGGEVPEVPDGNLVVGSGDGIRDGVVGVSEIVLKEQFDPLSVRVAKAETSIEAIGGEVGDLGNDIKDIEFVVDGLIGLPKWDKDKNSFTFITVDGTELTVDIPIVSGIEDGYYDKDTQELVFVLCCGNEIRVPVKDLIPVFKGYDGEQIQTVIDNGEVIRAILKKHSVSEKFIDPQFIADLEKAMDDRMDAHKTSPSAHGELFEGKLDKDGTAKNAFAADNAKLLDGSTKQQIIEEAKSSGEADPTMTGKRMYKFNSPSGTKGWIIRSNLKLETGVPAHDNIVRISGGAENFVTPIDTTITFAASNSQIIQNSVINSGVMFPHIIMFRDSESFLCMYLAGTTSFGTVNIHVEWTAAVTTSGTVGIGILRNLATEIVVVGAADAEPTGTIMSTGRVYNQPAVNVAGGNSRVAEQYIATTTGSLNANGLLLSNSNLTVTRALQNINANVNVRALMSTYVSQGSITTWSATTTYAVGAVVAHGGYTWIKKIAGGVGIAPNTTKQAAEFWDMQVFSSDAESTNRVPPGVNNRGRYSFNNTYAVNDVVTEHFSKGDGIVQVMQFICLNPVGASRGTHCTPPEHEHTTAWWTRITNINPLITTTTTIESIPVFEMMSRLTQRPPIICTGTLTFRHINTLSLTHHIIARNLTLENVSTTRCLVQITVADQISFRDCGTIDIAGELRFGRLMAQSVTKAKIHNKAICRPLSPTHHGAVFERSSVDFHEDLDFTANRLSDGAALPLSQNPSGMGIQVRGGSTSKISCGDCKIENFIVQIMIFNSAELEVSSETLRFVRGTWQGMVIPTGIDLELGGRLILARELIQDVPDMKNFYSGEFIHGVFGTKGRTITDGSLNQTTMLGRYYTLNEEHARSILGVPPEIPKNWIESIFVENTMADEELKDGNKLRTIVQTVTVTTIMAINYRFMRRRNRAGQWSPFQIFAMTKDVPNIIEKNISTYHGGTKLLDKVLELVPREQMSNEVYYPREVFNHFDDRPPTINQNVMVFMRRFETTCNVELHVSGGSVGYGYRRRIWKIGTEDVEWSGTGWDVF